MMGVENHRQYHVAEDVTYVSDTVSSSNRACISFYSKSLAGDYLMIADHAASNRRDNINHTYTLYVLTCRMLPAS